MRDSNDGGKKPVAESGFTNADLAAVRDFPELTDAELATSRPFAEAFPDLAASIGRLRESQKTPIRRKVRKAAGLL